MEKAAKTLDANEQLQIELKLCSNSTNESERVDTDHIGQSHDVIIIGKTFDRKDNSEESPFDCSICLERPKDAVVGLCGHLFCWLCLHQWFLTGPRTKRCPVCKSIIYDNNVIPLYGRDRTGQEDPRESTILQPTYRIDCEIKSFYSFLLSSISTIGTTIFVLVLLVFTTNIKCIDEDSTVSSFSSSCFTNRTIIRFSLKIFPSGL